MDKDIFLSIIILGLAHYSFRLPPEPPGCQQLSIELLRAELLIHSFFFFYTQLFYHLLFARYPSALKAKMQKLKNKCILSFQRKCYIKKNLAGFCLTSQEMVLHTWNIVSYRSIFFYLWWILIICAKEMICDRFLDRLY